MSKIEDFVRLIDTAIAEAELASEHGERMLRKWMVSDAAEAKRNFETLRADALAGKLHPSAGAGLGISRALGEWAPDGLLSAGIAVENFYRQHF